MQAVQLLLKYIQSPELRDHLPRIVDMLGSLAEKDRLTEYLQVILEYIFQASENVDVSDIHNALKLIPQGEELMPTIAEKLRQGGCSRECSRENFRVKELYFLSKCKGSLF